MSEAGDYFFSDGFISHLIPAQNPDPWFIHEPAPEEQYRVQNLDNEREEEMRRIVAEINNSHRSKQDNDASV